MRTCVAEYESHSYKTGCVALYYHGHIDLYFARWWFSRRKFRRYLIAGVLVRMFQKCRISLDLRQHAFSDGLHLSSAGHMMRHVCQQKERSATDIASLRLGPHLEIIFGCWMIFWLDRARVDSEVVENIADFRGNGHEVVISRSKYVN